jgi:AcrR family transcriptional regulator
MTSARERLLDTAAKLFYDQGIAATGIDRIVAESGVSKPTLYAQFGSKSALVAAVLQRRHDHRLTALDQHVRASSTDPRERLLAVFDWLADWHKGPGRRGCAFLNAAVELTDSDDPGREVILRQKRWMQDYLVELTGQAGAADPDRLGAELMLLVEGANARVLVEGGPGAARAARRVAALLVHEATTS